MKKKWVALLAAVALMAGLTVPAVAAGGTTAAEPNPVSNTADPFVASPSVKQEVETDNQSIEIVTDNVVTGGFIRPLGASELRPLEDIDYPVVKITTLAMSQVSNAKVDASNPGATDSQKSGMMTESGVTYAKNAKVNETAERYDAAQSTSEFVGSYSKSFLDGVVAASQAGLKDYAVIQVVDISANELAIATGQTVRLTFSAPGVKTNSKVMVARIVDGSMEFVAASAGNSSISFTFDPSYQMGTYVLMTRVD